MTLAMMRRHFADANVMGRFNQANLTVEGLQMRARGRAMRQHNLAGCSALSNRILTRGYLIAGIHLAGDRLFSPMTLGAFAVDRTMQTGLYPVGEVVFGRGTSVHRGFQFGMPCIDNVLGAWRAATQHGLVGTIVEALPLRLAAALEARGADTLAQACLGGAILGRCALQIPRAAVALWAISETVLLVSIFEVALLALEGAARSTRWGLDTAFPRPPGGFVGGARAGLDGFISSLATPIRIVIERERPDGLVAVQAPQGRVSHEDVGQLFSAAARRFLLLEDPDAHGGREVREVADTIANDLRRYCANEPDNSALRGGLSSLYTTMELTYEEAHWPKPAELR